MSHLFPVRWGKISFLILTSLFIYLFMAVLVLRCFVWSFSSGGEWGLLFTAMLRLLIVVAFWLQGRGFRRVGFSSCSSRTLELGLRSCGTQAWLLHIMWNLPRWGTEPMFPPLAGRFLPTAPPEKSPVIISSLLGFPGCKSEYDCAGKLLPSLIQSFHSYMSCGFELTVFSSNVCLEPH